MGGYGFALSQYVISNRTLLDSTTPLNSSGNLGDGLKNCP